MNKCALFIHGYAASGKLWTSFLKGNKPGPLVELFQGSGYTVDYDIDMPGAYLDREKGFDYYARHIAGLVENALDPQPQPYLCPCCGQEIPGAPLQPTPEPADEITLVCHSMGGVAARLYLSDPAIGDPAAKKKVVRLITLASPHHGTDVTLEEILSGILGALGPAIMPMVAGFIPGIAAAIPGAAVTIPAATSVLYPTVKAAVLQGQCYREIQRDTRFVQRLNYDLSFPSHVDFHSIWTNVDRISSPVHTAVVDQAQNHYIDDVRVFHMNIMKNFRSCDIVADILRGKATPNGLQTYPQASGCLNAAQHFWKPIRIPSFCKKEYLWQCENSAGRKTCPAQETSQLRPPLTGSDHAGCAIGGINKDYYMHTWRKTGHKKYQCKKCSRTYEGLTKPKANEGHKCRKPFPHQHRWHLVWYEWKCKECGKTIKSIRIPPLLGCDNGKIHKRNHDWYRATKRYLYRFECNSCGERTWHRD